MNSSFDNHLTEYIDVSVVAATTRTGVTSAQLISRREKHKHVRYPGGLLIPFVVDVRGSWGKEAIAWSKGLLRHLDPKDRAEASWRLRQWRVVTISYGSRLPTNAFQASKYL